MPSIVDPAQCRGGAWAATRGLLAVLDLAFPDSTVDCVPLPEYTRAGHRARQLRSIIAATFDRSIPAKVRFAANHRVRHAVAQRVSAHPPDLAFINGSDLLWLLPHLPASVPVLVIVHNIEHELYALQTSTSRASRIPGVSRLLNRDLRSLERFERKALPLTDGAIFLSTADMDTALTACPGIRAIVIPPVFSYATRTRRAMTSTLRLGMFADFTWWPSRDALRWFLDRVWPHVPRGVELRLFGNGSESVTHDSARVTCAGFVYDPADVFAECDMMIAPAITGAGVKVKVAEALYNRVPVIASPQAVRGLEVFATSGVHRCPTADDWVSFLSSPAGRAFAESVVPAEIAAGFSPASVATKAGPFVSDTRSARGGALTGPC